MATIQTEDYGPVTFPDTPPIHLEGEADAYPGELFEDAYKRLFYVACQCGYMVSQGETAEGPHVTVRTNTYTFRLVFQTGTLTAVRRETYSGWARMWGVA